LLGSDEELAERMLQQATAKLPVEPLAFFYLADAAERCGHLETARQALLDYRALEGEERDARRRASVAERVADLSMRMSDPHTAVGWYQRAADAIPPESSLLVRLADAQWQAGGVDAARATLARALEKDPLNAAARALQRRMR
jgi:predicted Zn-dependent protease